MAGGGANSAVWAQLFADVLGRRIIIPAGTDEKLPAGIRVTRVNNLGEAIIAGGGRATRRVNGKQSTDGTAPEVADAPF